MPMDVPVGQKFGKIQTGMLSQKEHCCLNSRLFMLQCQLMLCSIESVLLAMGLDRNFLAAYPTKGAE